MARFSAFDSTSSEGSGSESEAGSSGRKPSPSSRDVDSENEDSSNSSSDDDMQQDNPESKNQDRKAKLSNVGDDEEISSEHSSDEESSADAKTSRSQSNSPEPEPLNRTRIERQDGTLIPWTTVDSQRMHVMQTSLFRVPEEAAALKALNQPPRVRLLVQPSLNRKHSRDSDGDGLRLESRERSSFAHDIDPMPYRPSRKYARVDSATSSSAGQEGAFADAGLTFGRSFRVGWGPQGKLIHLGELCAPQHSSKVTANSSILTKTTIPTADTDRTVITSNLLQHHLSHSPIEPDEDGVPFANPSSKLSFASFVDLFAPTDNSYEASLFRLGHALFDDIELHLSDSVSVDIQNRVLAVRRKAALSSWLESVVAPTVENALKDAPSARSSAVAFTLLTGHQVERACEVAMDGGDIKLATLISQAGGDFEFQEDLQSQLEVWRAQKVDVHIDESIRKVYALLAGLVGIVVAGSKENGLDKCPDVDVTQGLDWKRTFGLYLWYAESLDASVTQIFQTYNSALKESGVVPPPWYRETTLPDSVWKQPSGHPPDGLFSLIRLHSEPSCSLSQVLTPLSFGSSPIDYSVPWHLYIILSRCMRLRDFADRDDPGVDIDMDVQDDDRVEGHSPSADLLASSYAFQLEGLGLVQEALFVLLHIEGSIGREKAIKDMLARSASRLDEWTVRGIIGSLKIPAAWVHEAKAYHALDNGEVYEAYQLYLAAELYSAAHDVAVLELAPDAIIRQDLQLLKSLFAKIAGHSVNGWHVRGKVLLDYANVMIRLPELYQLREHDAIPDASQAMELDELTRSIPKLIGLLPDILRDRSDARHNAALAQMISGLMSKMGPVRTLNFPQPVIIDEATKLRHIHSTAYERFLTSIEAAA